MGLPLALLTLLLAFTPGLACAQSVPAMVNYQGLLTDSLGDPVTNGYYQVQFRIWDDADMSGTGNYIWGRSYPLYVAPGGQFNILLNDDGGLVTMPATPQATNLLAAFAGPARFLGLTVTANPQGTIPTPTEIKPRQQLVTAPYAIQAENAANATNLAGIPGGQYLTKTVFPSLSDQPKSVLKWGPGPTPSKSGIFDYDGKVLITTATSPSAPASGVALQVGGGALQASTITNSPGTDLGLASSGTVKVAGKVNMFQAMQEKADNTDYTADTDGFLLISIYAMEAQVVIEGVSLWMEALQPDSNNQSASFPVRKGAAWRVNTSRKQSDHKWVIRWMPVGL